MSALTAAIGIAVGGVALYVSGWQRGRKVDLAPELEPESIEDRTRRERLQVELWRVQDMLRKPPAFVDAEAFLTLRELTLRVVIAWTDPDVDDEAWQAIVEELATYLVQTS